MKVVIFGLISAHPGRNRGGTSVSVVRLANHLVDRGLDVDLVTLEATLSQEIMGELDSRIGRYALRGRRRLRIFGGLLGYLATSRPDIVVSFDTRANTLAGITRCIPFLSCPVIASIHSSVEVRLREGGRRDARRRRTLASAFQRVDRIVAISQGLSDEVVRLADVSPSKVHVIPSLVVSPSLLGYTQQSVDHVWYTHPRECPLILGVGRLEDVKDFSTLLRAFRLVRIERSARLVILGRGSMAEELSELAEELGIRKDVDFPGFVMHPVSWMAGADLFVLSSRTEGFGMVLAEAMAAGCPVISTDCGSGPREILADGQYGPLVPVGDPVAMAEAMRALLDRPPRFESLQSGAQRFSVERNGDAFFELLQNVASNERSE